MTAFDWYQATIAEHVTDVAEGLRTGLADCREVRTSARGGNGYLNSIAFLDSRGDEVGRLMHGGNANPNFRAVSHHARDAARTVRRLWPRHRVTRMDVAVDYTGEGVFDHLHAIARDVADRNRLKTGLMFQPDLLDRGRTYRIGSPASPVMVRLYEKGLLEASRGRNEDPHWTRLELQVRPQKEAKARFATVSEREAWGATRWTSQLIERVLGEEPERLDVDPRRESEWERTQAALVPQSGRLALSGGVRAAGGPEEGITTEEAVEAYLRILREDLLSHVRGGGRKPADPQNRPRIVGLVRQSS